MYKILKRDVIAPNVVDMKIEAPDIARKIKAGQFIILRVSEDGERIPLTVCDYDREKGFIRIIAQVVGATTLRLSKLEEGQSLHDLVGPLGKPTVIKGLKKVALVAGGIGSAIIFPIAKALKAQGTEVHIIVGYRSKENIALLDELTSASDKLVLMTDDGSAGVKGLVTNGLQSLIDEGNKYDEVIAIGPLIMMKFVTELCKKNGLKITVSMNPIMIDGTGMCGGCRITVGGERKFACVDGPDFDGALIDFDEVMQRARTYKEFETNQFEKAKKELGE